MNEAQWQNRMTMLVNSCDAYEDLGLQYVPPQAVDARIADCPAVFIAPIVRNGKQATVGYHPEIWQEWK